MYKKNDPLVNSVKAIMEQNEHRRRVETKLCEELGIYSRKELPREHLANYDALLEQRIEEALNYSVKQKKLAAIAGNPKKIDAKDLEGARKGHASHIEEEEDEKIASDGRPYMTSVYPTKPDGSSSGPGKRVDPNRRVISQKDFEDIISQKDFEDSLKEEEQDSRNPLPPSGAKERIHNKLIGTKSSVNPSYKHQGPTSSDREEMNKKMENLDEMGRAKAARYATKAVNDISHDSFIAGGASQSEKSRGTALEFDKKAMKRQKGVNLAIKKLSGSAKVNANEDVQLDEKAPKGAKYERMVKHIKDKYKKDGLTDNEKSIAYATAHKAKKMDENLTLDDVMEEIARTLGDDAVNQIISGAPGAAGLRARPALTQSRVARQAPTSTQGPAPTSTQGSAPVTRPEKFTGNIDQFRKTNPGATLGQFMNAQKGLTARAGGANDPEVIAAKRAQSTNSAEKTSPVYVPKTGTTASDQATTQRNVAAARDDQEQGAAMRARASASTTSTTPSTTPTSNASTNTDDNKRKPEMPIAVEESRSLSSTINKILKG